MKTIIAGGRAYHLRPKDHALLDTLGITEVVSGQCSGADRGGELWAASAHIPVRYFPANWSMYGRAAGPLRNKHMAEYADALVAFPGGRGTASMLREAKRLNLKILVVGAE